MITTLIAETIQRIDQLARRDPGQRGFVTFASVDHLGRAAEQLLTAERVILVTGFCIRAAMIGENDGPPGTLAVAEALRQLGKDVHLVTDRHSAGLLTAGAAAFGKPFPTLELSLDQVQADQQIAALLTAFLPTHVVAIERPGNAIDGHRYSMRGESLDDLVPSADRLLQLPRSYRTIAIGDGGNELGMGSLRDSLMHHVLHGELIFAATAADEVIPAGISNWGAYALVAALSLLAGKLLLRSPQLERAVLEALLAAGAVDGCTRLTALSVDGIPWEEYAVTLSEIYEETRRALN
ncbi:MAG: glutamate cyclase domain-containing protein [Betaproteobacteria bacterium]